MYQHNIRDFDAAASKAAGYAPEASISHLTRQALTASAILFFGVFGTAAVVPIGGAVIGSGQLGVESHVKRIAHPQGGVISQILVKDGDAVRKNQILMRFDASVSGANADYSTQSLFQLLAERAVLEAERDGRGDLAFPKILTESQDPAAREAMKMSQRGFQLRAAENSSIQIQLVHQADQYEQQIAGYRAQIAALRRQRSLIEPERAGARELWDKQLITISRLNQLERTDADIEGSIASLQATIAQTHARIAETREQALNARQSYRANAATQLARVMEALNQQQVQSASATDQYERSVIRAPADGVVDKLAFTTAGDVVRPAETIMTVVPSKDDLIVEAAIRPADIDRVEKGQAARLRLTALNTRMTPELDGTVTYVAPERSQDEKDGTGFFRIRVSLDEKQVRALKLPLKPGMPAEVFVSTGERSMLSYITKPLRDQLARAFRD